VKPAPHDNLPNEPVRFVTCRCQHCNGGIEFDAAGFAKGEIRAKIHSRANNPRPAKAKIHLRNAWTF